MTEENKALVPVPGSAMALPPELAAELADLEQSGEELGGTLLDMLAIYSADRDRWKTGETKKDSILGIRLFGVTGMRTFWPPDAPIGNEPPSCWSLGGDDARPHKEAAEPQHETCEGCPWNEFQTAKQGRGKACKTKRADFIIEIDSDKLEADENGTPIITADAVLGIALIRASATAKETRASIGQWAKEIRSYTQGIPQLVLTRWGFDETKNSGGTTFYAPTLTCEGPYSCDSEAMEEIVQTSKDLRDGTAEQILTTLAGRVEHDDNEAEAE